MSKRVLVTGAGGFIGPHVIAHLVQHTDWEVIALDAFKSELGSTRRRLAVLAGNEGEGWTSFEHDMTQPLTGGFWDCDYVLSIGSASSVPKSIENPAPFVMNNVGLMVNLLEWARVVKPEKVIHLSSAEVYGATADGEPDPLEGDPHRPSNPYAASKAAQDDLAFAYWRTYDVPIAIATAMNIFGETQDPSKFVPLVLGKVLRGETVKIHAAGQRPGTRFYQHARNLADALLFMLREVPIRGYSAHPDEPFTAYHVVGEREVDNVEMASLIAEFAGERQLDFELVEPDRPGHDNRFALDGGKLADAGWKAPVGFENSLRQTVEWTVEHPEWL